jgi:hypothetical protein
MELYLRSSYVFMVWCLVKHRVSLWCGTSLGTGTTLHLGKNMEAPRNLYLASGLMVVTVKNHWNWAY